MEEEFTYLFEFVNKFPFAAEMFLSIGFVITIFAILYLCFNFVKECFIIVWRIKDISEDRKNKKKV